MSVIFLIFLFLFFSFNLILFLINFNFLCLFRSWDVEIRNEDELKQIKQAENIDWDDESADNEEIYLKSLRRKEEKFIEYTERMEEGDEDEEKEENFQLPPTLLESTRINFPSQKGFIEIGRKPIDLGNGSFDFKLRIILFNLDIWLELTEEEGINFFLFLRRSDLFDNEWMGESAFLSETARLFNASFSITKETDKRVTINFTNGSVSGGDIANLSKDDLLYLLCKEKYISNTIQRVRECALSLIDRMNALKQEVFQASLQGDHVDPLGIKEIAMNSTDWFKLEMVTNWWSFFCNVIYNDKKNIF